jgi:4-alpha-glucanotransferase
MKYVYVIEYYTPNYERVRDNVLARHDEEARQKFAKKHADDVDFATIVDWIRVDY